MPVIAVTAGALSKEQKQQLVERLTSSAVEITKIPADHFIITINELSYDNLGCGGRTVASMRASQK